VLNAIQVTEKPSDTSILAPSSGQRGEYSVPGHGKLQLRVPDTWKDFSKPLKEPPAVGSVFRPPSGDAFIVQVTCVWLDAEKLAKFTPEWQKAAVLKASLKPLAMRATRSQAGSHGRFAALIVQGSLNTAQPHGEKNPDRGYQLEGLRPYTPLRGRAIRACARRPATANLARTGA
jgi:hypothetical protein